MITSDEFCGSGDGSGDGELVEIFVAPLNELDIANPIIVDGFVDDLPWLTADSPWVSIKPIDEDDVNVFEEIYNDVTEVITQNTTIKIAGISKQKLDYLRIIEKKCALAIMLLFSSGKARLQGLDRIFTASGWTFIPTLNPVSVTQAANRSSTTVADNIVVSFKSIARNYAIYLNNASEVLSPGYQEIAPSVVLNLVGKILNVVWVGVGTKTLTINVNGNNIALPINAASIDLGGYLAWLQHSGAANMSFTVTATIVGTYGTGTATKQIPTKRTSSLFDSRIYNINGVNLYTGAPTIGAPTIVGNIVTEGNITNYNGWAPSTVKRGIVLTNNGTTTTISSGHDLSSLCGTITSSSNLQITGAALCEIGSFNGGILTVAILKDSANKITSINGVSCATVYSAPSVVLNLSGTTLTITWDDGGDPSPAKNLWLQYSGGQVWLDETSSSIDLLSILCGSTAAAYRIYDIQANITNTVGADSDVLIGAVELIEGSIVNGVDCFPSPIITINPPVGNILPPPTIDDGCGCGIGYVSYELDLGASTLYLDAGDFPYDLMNLCGQTVDYSWRTTLSLKVNAENNLTNFGTATAEVAVVTLDGFGPFTITSVNGVSC